MASRKTVGRRQRTVRTTSNVFAMFGQAEIQEFKEAFNLIDQITMVLLIQVIYMICLLHLGKKLLMILSKK